MFFVSVGNFCFLSPTVVDAVIVILLEDFALMYLLKKVGWQLIVHSVDEVRKKVGHRIRERSTSFIVVDVKGS